MCRLQVFLVGQKYPGAYFSYLGWDACSQKERSVSRQGLEGTTGRNNDNVAPHTHKHIQSFHLSESTGKLLVLFVISFFLLLKKKKPPTQNSLLCRNIPAGDEMAAMLASARKIGSCSFATIQIHLESSVVCWALRCRRSIEKDLQ